MAGLTNILHFKYMQFIVRQLYLTKALRRRKKEEDKEPCVQWFSAVDQSFQDISKSPNIWEYFLKYGNSYWKLKIA